MTQETYILMLTALTIGCVHTLLGPDHYIPFVVLARARDWTLRKTLLITVLCGLGHVGSSLLIGILGIALGIALNSLVHIESVRSVIAAWMMISFGFVYGIWGIKHSLRTREHSHLHLHPDGISHDHPHGHHHEHTHFHKKTNDNQLTPWILFLVFIFGPCESFIPILLFPAALHNLTGIILITTTFTIATVGTMILMVSLSIYGFRFLPAINLERHMHAIAGGSIFLCGIGIQFFGL